MLHGGLSGGYPDHRQRHHSIEGAGRRSFLRSGAAAAREISWKARRCMKLELKKIRSTAAAAAVLKAEKYRDLNQPFEAESICRDVLEASPEHAGALRTLGLALTDQFEGKGKGRFA